MTEKYVNEGLEILKIIDKYFPKRFDGRESIQWLHKHTTQGKQEEWAGFFFEEYCFPLLSGFLGGWKGPRITNNKRFDYQRDYVWDLKLDASKNNQGKISKWVILNDKRSLRRVIKLECGIGFIIAIADLTYDTDRKLRKWRDNYERKSSTVNARILKKHGNIITIKGVFIRNLKQLDDAVKKGWIKAFNQGKNADGSKREPKYQIKLDKVPKEFLIELK